MKLNHAFNPPRSYIFVFRGEIKRRFMMCDAGTAMPVPRAFLCTRTLYVIIWTGHGAGLINLYDTVGYIADLYSTIVYGRYFR